MPTPIVRRIKKEDIQQLVILCKEHAAYENASYSSIGKNERLLQYVFSSKGDIHCLVVEQDGQLLGYATILRQFSTWDAGYYLYMDCLYLREDSRGKGLGRKMMNEIKQFAIKQKCNIQWQTPEFNKKAIAFYKHLGANHVTKERFFWNSI